MIVTDGRRQRDPRGQRQVNEQVSEIASAVRARTWPEAGSQPSQSGEDHHQHDAEARRPGMLAPKSEATRAQPVEQRVRPDRPR